MTGVQTCALPISAFLSILCGVLLLSQTCRPMNFLRAHRIFPQPTRLVTAFHSTLAPSQVTVQNQPARVGAMRFLQPDLHPTCKLPLRPLGFYSGRSCFPSLDPLSVQQLREPSTHHVMAYPRSRRRLLYVAISRAIARRKELHHEHDRSSV